MKLKTKLIIVFMVVMVFPMLFTGVMMRAFVPEKATEIQQNCTSSHFIFFYALINIRLFKEIKKSH